MRQRRYCVNRMSCTPIHSLRFCGWLLSGKATMLHLLTHGQYPYTIYTHTRTPFSTVSFLPPKYVCVLFPFLCAPTEDFGVCPPSRPRESQFLDYSRDNTESEYFESQSRAEGGRRKVDNETKTSAFTFLLGHPDVCDKHKLQSCSPRKGVGWRAERTGKRHTALVVFYSSPTQLNHHQQFNAAEPPPEGTTRCTILDD